MTRIELLNWSEAREWAAPIRLEVFVGEQRVPAGIEIDDQDTQSVHALARTPEGQAVATGRLLPDGHIGRMAVLREWRKKGIGGQILEALVGEARRRGLSEAVLSAQSHAIEFYLRHGFHTEGPGYMEAGIAHRLMRRAL